MLRSLVLITWAALAAPAASALAGDDVSDDPNLWLEDVTGDEALAWVRARNEASTAEVAADADFEPLKARILSILDATDRIPYVNEMGGSYYNFWRDADHPRGVWRRTTLDSYRTDAPVWDVVFDLDAIAEAEGENWVWKGVDCLRPGFTRCLVSLSRGGADATVVREYDLAARAWVPDGFTLPEAKSDVGWIDQDTLFVGTELGEGSLTSSGYPRQVRRWTRGTPIADAPVVFEGEVEDVASTAWHDPTPGFERDVYLRAPTFFTNQVWVDTRKGRVAIDKPDSATARFYREWVFFTPREDWTVGGATYAAGSLLVARLDRWLKGKRDLEVLFAPDAHTSLDGWTATRHHVLLTTLRDVKSEVVVATPGKKGWTTAPLPGVPALGTVTVSAVDDETSDAYWMHVSDYLTPPTLLLGAIGSGPAAPLKHYPARFDTTGLAVAQHFATSKDGTKVPYFEVARADLTLDGTAPTLLYGYGGFEVSLQPGYKPEAGVAWLEKGGVYVVANIRGGGEYGPSWHHAALKENRHKAYEDFEAVAEDLIARKVTSTPHLGILGGSNGGLLMGNMYARRPDLWGAIVCAVPLLDMKRYSHLLAGASWMGEYGDPDDPEQWSFIQGFSPYHMVRSDVDYPPILFVTSTRDDRVHPGHARKMAARLIGWDKDVSYYENIEGGHGASANNAQAAFMAALEYTWLWQHVK
ncbi:MAG: S9 family peptidase [Alphaproteobacteria bacterium]|nr:S9 family peptidase [Alphaproteobacteria bacterium]